MNQPQSQHPNVSPACPRRGQILLAAAVAVGLLAVNVSLKGALDSTRSFEPGYQQTEQELEAQNSGAMAQILGEMRATAADLMWVKTERYLHRGVAYALHINSEAMAHKGELVNKEAAETETEHDHDDACGHEHEHEHEHGEACEHEHHHNMEAMIPQRQNDYRGWIGEIHRQTQPWQGPDAPHEHTQGEELLPWYRLLTYSNPHHWRGYAIGTWWLMSQSNSSDTGLEDAEAFLREGITNNPKVFQLRHMLGRLLMRRECWEPAIDSFEKGIALALEIRPQGGEEKGDLWTLSDEEDFAACYRYAALIRARKLDQPAVALEAVRAGLVHLPNDKPLKALYDELSSK